MILGVVKRLIYVSLKPLQYVFLLWAAHEARRHRTGCGDASYEALTPASARANTR